MINYFNICETKTFSEKTSTQGFLVLGIPLISRHLNRQRCIPFVLKLQFYTNRTERTPRTGVTGAVAGSTPTGGGPPAGTIPFGGGCCVVSGMSRVGLCVCGTCAARDGGGKAVCGSWGTPATGVIAVATGVGGSAVGIRCCEYVCIMAVFGSGIV